MKKILYKVLFGCLTVLTFASCENYLDKSPTDERTEKDIFTRFSEVENMVNRLYFMLRGVDRPLVYLRYNSESTLCDEEDSSAAEGNLFNKFNDGDNGPDSPFYEKTTTISNSAVTQVWWQQIYTHIHTCNSILEGIEKYKTPDQPDRPGMLAKRIGEVYFIRAYLHYCLVRNYGECCYMDHTADPNNIPKFTRENVHEVIQKICNDCDEAFERVLPRNNGAEFGHVDRGACLGLKAMARWIAATPLYNGSTLRNDNRNFAQDYQTYDPKRWEAARDAAKAVMDYTDESGQPRFALYQGAGKNDFTDKRGNNENGSKVYRRLWEMFYYSTTEAKKSEWIWYVLYDKSQGWFTDQYPPSANGSAREMPVQNQVDEYEVVGPDGYGYPIYALKQNHKALYNDLITEEQMAASYDDGNPYANRDPRFYRDITYHGAMFKGKIINTAPGSTDAINAANSTTTGYFLHKYIDGSFTKGDSETVKIDCPPLIRLATIHLIYAEAVTRTTGPSQEVYDLVNAIRERAFMAKMPPATIHNRDLMLDYINRERRVELFHEKTRFWSCRLYLEATSTGEMVKNNQWTSLSGTNDEKAQKYFDIYGAYPRTQTRICGMRPVEDPEGKIVIGGTKYRMERFWKEDRVFLEKHYLFPLPLVELQTAGIKQNPNW